MRYLGDVSRSGSTVGSDPRPLIHRMLVSGRCRTLMDGLLMDGCSLVHGMLVRARRRTLMDRCSLDYGMLVRGCSLIRSPLTSDGRCPRGRRSMNSRWCGPPHRLRMWPLLLRGRRPPQRLGLWRPLAWLRLVSLLARLPLGH